MADPRNAQTASRLSEDIGDVLNAIRRMIAEDEALTSARDRLIAERDALDSLVQEDAGEFIARRYGGNAALARRLAGIADVQAVGQVRGDSDSDESQWPFGDRANAADAAQPVTAPRISAESSLSDPPRNDLARILSAGIAPSRPEILEPAADVAVGEPEQPAENSDAPRGWRAWVAPEPRQSRWAAPEQPASADDSFEAVMAQIDFDEGHDWKSRMRPDPVDVVATPVAAESDAAHVSEGSPLNSVAEADCAAADMRATPVFSTSFAGYQALFNLPTSPVTIDPIGFGGAGAWSAAIAPDADAVTTTAADAALTADDDASAEDGALLLSDAAIVAEADSHAAPIDAPSTITGLAPEDEEASIRDLLREMIQEELHGELGERYSRNIRTLIRREVAAAIDAHLERF